MARPGAWASMRACSMISTRQPHRSRSSTAKIYGEETRRVTVGRGGECPSPAADNNWIVSCPGGAPQILWRLAFATPDTQQEHRALAAIRSGLSVDLLERFTRSAHRLIQNVLGEKANGDERSKIDDCHHDGPNSIRRHRRWQHRLHRTI